MRYIEKYAHVHMPVQPCVEKCESQRATHKLVVILMFDTTCKLNAQLRSNRYRTRTFMEATAVAATPPLLRNCENEKKEFKALSNSLSHNVRPSRGQ